ncbi:type IV secretory system conjugative DNA transfer family protein, partial [Tsukamurella sputi]
DSLGPRSSDILRYCLGALALRDDASLVMLPLLLSNPGFRRSITQVAVKRDPIGAGSFWAWFDALSPEAASTVTAPLSNKLRPLLTPTLRAVLGQTAPRFNVRQVLTENKILLVPLQVGVLGHSAAQLLAAAVLAELWQAIRERVAIPEDSRTPVQVYIDEVQDFLRLPT